MRILLVNVSRQVDNYKEIDISRWIWMEQGQLRIHKHNTSLPIASSIHSWILSLESLTGWPLRSFICNYCAGLLITTHTTCPLVKLKNLILFFCIWVSQNLNFQPNTYSWKIITRGIIFCANNIKSDRDKLNMCCLAKTCMICIGMFDTHFLFCTFRAN